MIDGIFAITGLIGALVAFSERPGAIGAGMLLAGFAAGVVIAIVLKG